MKKILEEKVNELNERYEILGYFPRSFRVEY